MAGNTTACCKSLRGSALSCLLREAGLGGLEQEPLHKSTQLIPFLAVTAVYSAVSRQQQQHLHAKYGRWVHAAADQTITAAVSCMFQSQQYRYGQRSTEQRCISLQHGYAIKRNR